MRIAFIGQKGIPAVIGGVEKHVDELATQLAAQGHDVLVYVRGNYTDKRLKEYKGVRLVHTPNIRTKHLDAISHTLFSVLDVVFRRVDVIHFHSIGPSALIPLVKMLQPFTPVVATYHSMCYLHQKWNFLAKACLKLAERLCCYFADKVIAVSQDLADYAECAYGVKPAYIPNGVIMPAEQGSDIIKERWGLEPRGYFLTTSRFIRHKGLHYAIEAFARIATDKKLVIAGDGFHSDAYVKFLKKLAARNPDIILTGPQTGEALAQLYANAYLLLQPSESEGLSISILDALSHGTPVLASDIPENLAVVRHIGFTFSNKDVSDLAEKLAYLEARPRLIESFRAIGRRHVEESYNWEKLVHRVEAVYRDAVAIYSTDEFEGLFKRWVLKIMRGKRA